jgi:sulfatase modifying factor 1
VAVERSLCWRLTMLRLTMARRPAKRLTRVLALACAAPMLATCSGGQLATDGGSHLGDGSSREVGAMCPPDAAPASRLNCVSGVTDYPPVPVLHFQTRLPENDDDYPYSAGSFPMDGPPPRTALYLSAKGSADPEGDVVSIFWNVQDPTGAYVPIDPAPTELEASFYPNLVGPHTVTLEVTEAHGLRQTSQATLVMNITPIPCADDGVSPPCSDGIAVPGGTFVAGSGPDAGEANERPSHMATIAPFVLDKYEVTVGRFRKFLAQYTGAPPGAGMGAHPLVQGSGWATYWSPALPVSAEDFSFAISECGGTWTPDAGASEARPIGCVTWYEAFAFCVWDNKRLPTEAEWEYAAAGGDEERTYPWGNEAPSVDFAVYACLFDGQPSCASADLPVVGSVAAGAGRWGHLDLAGSVWEWVMDVYAPYTGDPCDNCATVTALDTTVDGTPRGYRGGDYQFDQASSLRAASRYGFDPAYPQQTIGFRCASPAGVSPPDAGVPDAGAPDAAPDAGAPDATPP